jgi:hypothetical protein
MKFAAKTCIDPFGCAPCCARQTRSRGISSQAGRERFCEMLGVPARRALEPRTRPRSPHLPRLPMVASAATGATPGVGTSRQSDHSRGGVERANGPSDSWDFRPYARQRGGFATTGPDARSASQQQSSAYGEPVRVLTVLRRGGREVGRRERLYAMGATGSAWMVTWWCCRASGGAGRFPGLAPGHRRRRPPGQLRRAPSGRGGAGPGRQCANVVFGRSAPRRSGRRDEGTSEGGRRAPARQQQHRGGCWPPACAWRARDRSRRSPAGSSGAVPTGARSRAGRPREERGEWGSESAPSRRRLKGQLRSIPSIPGLRVAFARRLGHPAGEARSYLRVRRPLGWFVHRKGDAEHRGGP